MLLRRTICLLPLLAGCYVYQPIGTSVPQTGEHLRLTLTDSGTAGLAAQLGPRTEAVSGRFLQDSSGGYVLAVLDTRNHAGVETGWRGEQVAVPRPLVARAELRRFSRNRTVLMAIGTVAGSLLVRQAFWGPGGVFSGGPPQPGPTPR